jgi:protein-S-isoprenylcysteine O-methyltransferase Ste14
MSHDTMFRLILGVLSVLLYINHHIIHRRPSVRRKARPKGSFGGLEFWLVVTASLWTVSLGFYAFGFKWFDYSAPLPQWLRWVGVAGMILCAPLSQWTYATLGAHFSKKLELRDDHQLIRSGPYRYVRHPMYSTLFLCATSTCLVSANLFVMATTCSVAVVFLLRMKKEEDMLVQRFGDTYREYRRQAGALLPRFATMMPWRPNFST